VFSVIGGENCGQLKLWLVGVARQLFHILQLESRRLHSLFRLTSNPMRMEKVVSGRSRIHIELRRSYGYDFLLLNKIVIIKNLSHPP
jgi:hypothetical protein